MALGILRNHEAPYFFFDYSQLGMDDISYCCEKLSQQERLYADSLLCGRDLYVATRASLRIILEKIFNIHPNILVSEYGKPYTTNIACEFNVSHSKSAALIVLGGPVPVGADLEFIHNAPDLIEVSQLAFHESEKATFSESGYLNEVFYRIWVRKEAALKAEGLGIIEGPSRYYLEERAPDYFGLYRDNGDTGEGISIMSISLNQGYIGALAAANCPLNFREVKLNIPRDLFISGLFGK
jgi:4'-phosphopantetheinyl transferase